MSVARHTEITASGASIEEAIQNGIGRATDTLENVQQAWVKEVVAKVDGGRITEYRVDMKVSFVLKD